MKYYTKNGHRTTSSSPFRLKTMASHTVRATGNANFECGFK